MTMIKASIYTALALALSSCASSLKHQASSSAEEFAYPHDSSAIIRDYAPVNGLRLFYEIHGEEREGIPPLVLLHGGGSTIRTSFGKILPLLAQDRQVIAFDQQGHGHTADIEDRPFSFAQSAKDAVALLDHLGIESADFFGYSNGGHIAIQIAIDFPKKVRRLIIESAMSRRGGAEASFWNRFQNAKLEDMPLELREEYERTSPHPGKLRLFFDKSVERMKSFKGWSSAQLRGIRSHTLIVSGDSDVVRPENAVELFRTLPNAQLCILPATNHMSIVHDIGRVAEIVRTFLRSAPQG